MNKVLSYLLSLVILESVYESPKTRCRNLMYYNLCDTDPTKNLLRVLCTHFHSKTNFNKILISINLVRLRKMAGNRIWKMMLAPHIKTPVTLVSVQFNFLLLKAFNANVFFLNIKSSFLIS